MPPVEVPTRAGPLADPYADIGGGGLAEATPAVTTTPSDFESAYGADVRETRQAASPDPSPPPSDIESVYSDIVNNGASATAKAFESTKREPPDFLDIFDYEVANNMNQSLQGLFRGIADIAIDDRQKQPLHDVADALEEYRVGKLLPSFGVSEEDTQTTKGQVAGAVATVFDIAPGPAVMITKMAGQTYNEGFRAGVENAKAAGETDEMNLRKAGETSARQNVVMMAPVLAAYAAGGKIAGTVAKKLVPEAGALARGAVGATASSLANLTVSAGARIAQGGKVLGDLRQNLTDIFFGLHGGVKSVLGGKQNAVQKPGATSEIPRTSETRKGVTDDTRPLGASDKSLVITGKTETEVAPTKTAPPAAPKTPQEIADALGLRFEGIQDNEGRMPNEAQFTIIDPGSPAHGATFGMPVGSTLEAVKARSVEKRVEFGEKAAPEPKKPKGKKAKPAPDIPMELTVNDHTFVGKNLADVFEQARKAFGIYDMTPEEFESAARKEPDFRLREVPDFDPAKEEQLKIESEKDLLRQIREDQKGDELFVAVEKYGGLPGKTSQHWKGELQGLYESAAKRMFRKGARSLDDLTTVLRADGFKRPDGEYFQTADDLIAALEQRTSSGKKHFPERLEGGYDEIAGGRDIFGAGPGAASAEEPLVKYEARKFATRLQADEGLVQELKDMAGNRYYEPISNKVTAAEASKVIEERGIAQSINLIQDEANGIDFRTRVAVGELIIKRLNEAARGLQKSSLSDASLLIKRAADIAEWAGDYGTRLGQGVQAFAMWNKLTPEGKLLTVRRTVQKIRDRFTQENGDQVQAVIKAANTGDISKLRELSKKNKIARKVKSKFQDLIDASQPQLLTEDTFYDVVGERLGIPVFSKEVAANVLKLADAIDAAPEGYPRDKATLALSRYIANLKGFAARDVALGVYYGNMLSGYNTQIVNALDTFFNVGSEVNGLAAVNPRAASVIYRGLLRGFMNGRLDAMLALSEGRMITDGKWLEVPKLMEIAKFGEKGGVPISVKGTPSRVVKAIAESKPAYILRGWKYVSRLMAASDAIMFRGAKEARAALLAHRLATGEGLRGKELHDRVNELLGLDVQSSKEFEQQAAAEGFTGSKAKVRIAELRELSRPKDIDADASDFAGEATYNHTPHGVLGAFSNAVAKLSDKYVPLKAVVPFTRIVANVTNRGLNYTPLGFKRAFYGYSHEAPPAGDARSALIARAAMGTLGLTGLLTLQETGYLKIHGNGPSDRERRRQLLNAGWKPYSLQIGEDYFSYVYSPVGLGLAVMGNMTDSYRYDELGQKDAFTRGGYAISRIGSTVFSQSFLSGLSTVFRALSGDPGDTVASIKQLFSATAGSFTTPRIIVDIQRLFDPTAYQSDSIAGDLLRNTPFSALVNKPTLNAFGEPVQMPTNRFISKIRDDEVWRLIARTGVRISVPSKYTTVPDGEGGKRRITPEEYYSYLKQSGQELKTYISDNMESLSELEKEDLQDKLNDEAKSIRERVKTGMFQ